MEWKLQLAKGMYHRGLPEKDIIEMFRFMDWMMVLPPPDGAAVRERLKAV